MKNKLLNDCINAEEARLYDFVSSCTVIESDLISTMGVNKKAQIVINPSFYEKEHRHIIGLLIHESLHVFFEHVHTNYENKEIANIAFDIIINDHVLRAGYSLPEGGCTYETCDVPRSLKTSHEIYHFFLQNIPPQEMIETVVEMHNIPEFEEEEGDAETLEEIVKIIETDIKFREIQTLREKCVFEQKPELVQKIERVLGKFLAPEFKRNYTRAPRFRIKDVLLPSSRTIAHKPTLSIYLDVSGSMGGENISKTLDVLDDISMTLQAYKIKNFTFNTETMPVENFEDIKTGGGTQFKKFHESDDSDVVFILTDCEFSFDFLENHNRKAVIILTMGDASNIKNCHVFKF